jgi:hypothetical protein
MREEIVDKLEIEKLTAPVNLTSMCNTDYKDD